MSEGAIHLNAELCFENKNHLLEGELIHHKNETSKHLQFA